MKKQILKSLLCLSLSAAMVFGEAGAVLAETEAAPVGTEAETEVDATAAAFEDEEIAADVEEAEAEAETAETVEEIETEIADTNKEEADAETAEAVEASEEAVDEPGEIDAVGEKIVAKYNLPNVTGLAYDRTTGILSWNKVAGADSYSIEICDAAGNHLSSRSTEDVYITLGSGFAENTAYIFKVTAKNESELYVVAANLASWGSNYDYDYSKYNSTTGTYTLYKYPTSAAAAQISAVVRVSVSKAVTALSRIALKEVTDTYAVFTVSPAAVQKGECIDYDYANNSGYKNDGMELKSYGGEVDTTNGYTGEISIPLSSFTSGDTIYLRARVYNPNYTLAAGQTDANRYSAYVSASYKVPAAVMDDVAVIVTSSSVRLKPSSTGTVTGYQYQRKNGKKWIDLAQQMDNYTDKGLISDTKYTYRVRGYIYNTSTKKTTYTDWKQVTAYTWGSSLNLKGSAASSKSIKLTWSKVAGADGYEIYRVDTNSSYYNMTKGEAVESFQNATLVKTIKKAKTVKYTDKKLTGGMEYTYIVHAYRTINKTKCYIEDYVSVPLSTADGISITSGYYTSSGTYTVNWKKIVDAAGYKVERYDTKSGQYVAYKTLKKSATSVTLPKVAVGSADVTYRIRPYKGTKIYGSTSVTVSPVLAAVKNVKATQTAEGVKVTWSAVAGADYYQVYRAKKDSAVYDNTTKTYSFGSNAALVYEVSYTDTSAGVSLVPTGTSKTDNNCTVYSYSPALNNAVNYSGRFYDSYASYSTDEIKGTSVVDKTVTVMSLIEKSDDPAYNKNTDPEYDKIEGEYTGYFGEYQKNANGSLKTETVTLIAGPQAGTEYYYFVRAVAKPANGANGNSDYTYSMGYTKAAQVIYTAKTAAKATKVSSAKSSKKATATVKIKKVKGAAGYAVYRSTKKGKGYVQIGTTTKVTYTDNNVVGGKTYYYKVAPYVKSENGTFIYSKLSAAKKVKVKK